MKTYYPPPSALEGNDLKSFVQHDVADKQRIENALILQAATGFGKTFAALATVYELKPITTLIIVPGIPLKQQWESIMTGINNVEVIVVNSFVFHPGETKRKYGLVIVDECHRILNKDSEWFSTALDIFESDKLLVMSATLNPAHMAFLKSKRPDVAMYKISLAWCFKNKLIPKHININIPVDLTLAEKSEIIKIQEQYDKYARVFANFRILNPFADFSELDAFATDCAPKVEIIGSKRIVTEKSIWTKGQLIGMMAKWRKSTGERKGVLQRAVNKQYVLNDFLERVRTEKPQKCLIFGKTIDFIEGIAENNPDAVCFHSKHGKKQKEEIFRQFFADEKPFLASINTIIEGFDMKSFAEAMGFSPESTTAQLAFRLAYDSDELKTIQAFGRILRYNENNPDQQVIQVNAYVNDFVVRGKTYLSQEKKWLINNLKNAIECIMVRQC